MECHGGQQYATSKKPIRLYNSLADADDEQTDPDDEENANVQDEPIIISLHKVLALDYVIKDNGVLITHMLIQWERPAGHANRFMGRGRMSSFKKWCAKYPSEFRIYTWKTCNDSLRRSLFHDNVYLKGLESDRVRSLAEMMRSLTATLSILWKLETRASRLTEMLCRLSTSRTLSSTVSTLTCTGDPFSCGSTILWSAKCLLALFFSVQFLAFCHRAGGPHPRGDRREALIRIQDTA